MGGHRTEVGLSYYSSLASSVHSMTLLCDFLALLGSGSTFFSSANAIIVGITSVERGICIVDDRKPLGRCLAFKVDLGRGVSKTRSLRESLSTKKGSSWDSSQYTTYWGAEGGESR